MTVIWCPLLAKAFMMVWNGNWWLMDGEGKIPKIRADLVQHTAPSRSSNTVLWSICLWTVETNHWETFWRWQLLASSFNRIYLLRPTACPIVSRIPTNNFSVQKSQNKFWMARVSVAITILILSSHLRRVSVLKDLLPSWFPRLLNAFIISVRRTDPADLK